MPRENKRKKPDRIRSPKGLWRILGAVLVLGGIGFAGAELWKMLCAAPYFRLETIVVTGNRHLGEEDIRTHLRLGRENLLGLDLKALETRLRESPWIRSLRIRKQLPDMLFIEIEEKAPLALLEREGRFALLDQDGREIERLPAGQIPFLPVIRNAANGAPLDPETLALLRALRETGVANGREMVEIEQHPRYGLVLTIDGLATRMGTGDFEGKLRRWATVEGGIRSSGMRVDYVDVRFDDRVVVREIAGGSKNG